MVTAFVDSVVWLPRSYCEREKLLDDYVVTVSPLGEEPFELDAYRARGQMIGFPRQKAIEYCRAHGVNVEDRMSRGVETKFSTKNFKLWEEQKPFVKEIIDAASTYQDFVVKAATGKGKTVCALYVAAKIGTTTVVVVDQENIRDQWIGQAKEKLGLSDADIGIVQAERLEYVGKKLVVAMVQTLTRKDIPADFWSYFGLAIFDECHTVGAPTFSRALMRFHAAIRFGLSATPKRRDALAKLIAWNIGEIRVLNEAQHAASKVYYLKSHGVYSWYANKATHAGRFLQEISDDGERNLLIANAIKWLYESGRDVLVIGDRIEQLCHLKAMCVWLLGMPEEDLGVYAGYKVVWGYEKNPQPKRHPVGWEKGTAYTPIGYALLKKRIPSPELKRIKSEAKVIFATYGMFQKGVDVPRLAGGIDATPRSTFTQVHGRILREHSGKLRPIWVTIRDVNSFRAEHQFSRRLSEYKESNAEVYEWQINKGIRPHDLALLGAEVADNIAELKNLRITTRLDGRCMLQTPTMPPK